MYPPMTPARVMVNTAAVLFVVGMAWLLIQIRSIILLLLLGIILASAIEPLVYRLRRRGLSRGQAILTIYAGILAVLMLGLYLIVPPLFTQGGNLIDDIPNIIENIRIQASASDNDFIATTGNRNLERLRSAYLEFKEDPPIPGGTALSVVTSVFGILFTTITVMIVAFYWMTEKAIIKRLVLGLFPLDRRDRAHGLWDQIEARVGGWTRGQLVLCGTIGLLSTVVYSPLVLDLDFWVALGIFAGLTELIPFIGPFLGGGAAAIVALTVSWEKALIVVGFTFALQQLEGAFLVPRVMKNAVGMTPLTVVLSVLVGGVLIGPLGSVLAIPVGAAVQVLLQDVLYGRRDDIDHGSGGVTVESPAVAPLAPAARAAVGTGAAGRGDGAAPNGMAPRPSLRGGARSALRRRRADEAADA